MACSRDPLLPSRTGGLLKPHVILIADAGGTIGWGHAVRQLALAEALVAKGVPTLFVSRTREALSLDWPCPVQHDPEPLFMEGEIDARVVFDGVRPRSEWALLFDDYGDGPLGDYLVDPHFGAVTRHHSLARSFLGPRWAPLRSEFEHYARNPRNENRSGVFVYGDAPDLVNLPPIRPASFNAKHTAKLMASCAVALVPPSMVALECLAVGTPVVLYVPGPKWQPIADAMVQAGVAHIWDGKDYTLGRVLADDGERKRMAEAGREAVDGLGAERLAEWLA